MLVHRPRLWPSVNSHYGDLSRFQYLPALSQDSKACHSSTVSRSINLPAERLSQSALAWTFESAVSRSHTHQCPVSSYPAGHWDETSGRHDNSQNEASWRPTWRLMLSSLSTQLYLDIITSLSRVECRSRLRWSCLSLQTSPAQTEQLWTDAMGLYGRPLPS